MIAVSGARVPSSYGRREISHARKYPEFCEITAEQLIADAGAGLSLGKSCSLPGRPSRRVVNIWRATHPDFDAELEAACDDRADEIADKVLVVAAEQARDPACRRVEVDALKWLASKLSKRYANKAGEGLTLEQTNIHVEGDMNLSPADAYSRMLGHG